MDYTEQLKNEYPADVIGCLRQRAGLEIDDKSMDKQFLDMTPSEVFQDVVGWNGLLGGYDTVIKDWIKSIYKVDLDKVETK